MDNCEKQISSLEEAKEILEKELTDPEVFSNPALSKEKNLEYEKTKKELEYQYQKWTEISHEIEEIEKTLD